MKILTSKILENKEISNAIFSMAIKADELAQTAVSGQFLEIYVNKGEHILPRPISIFDVDKKNGIIYVVYQVVGKGTECFSKMEAGEKVRVIGTLGNGFPLVDKKEYCLVGGGIGIPPIYYLCKSILEEYSNAEITVVLGYRSQPFLTQNFVDLGVRVLIATDDGSTGFKGNVLGLINETNIKPNIFYACGPKIMLNKLSEYSTENHIECYISMEERMACGVGACVGCAIKIKDQTAIEGWKYKKVCKDGPVFNSLEVVWDE